MHYTSYSEERFNSVILIIKETWSGWLIRLIHINGASLFFIIIYIHIARGLYFSRFKRRALWNRGVTILITIIAISFMGYVLPWGQISYWAVAVITNLFSVIPIVGSDLVMWIWGGFNVSSPTLTRFYSLHFLLPFILRAIVILHLIILHNNGSRNPIGTPSNMDKIRFHPYFTTKDIKFIGAIFTISIRISFFQPYLLGDPVNIIPANPMQTPLHIQPEWYFLTSYAILRAIPRKVAGVLALALSVLIFYLLPVMKPKFSSKFKITKNIIYWIFISIHTSLTKIGSIEAEQPFIEISKLLTIIYFSSLILISICFEKYCFENS